MSGSAPTNVPAAPRVTCRVCGRKNGSWRTTCEQCGARLPRREDAPPRPAWHPVRPGFVTLWALLLAFYLAIYLITLAITVAAGEPVPEDLAALGAAGVGVLVAYVIIGGVWRMRPWARLPAIGLHVALIVLFVLSEIARQDAALTPNDADRAAAFFDAVGGVVWLAAHVAAIIWFATHRAAFQRPPAHDPTPD